MLVGSIPELVVEVEPSSPVRGGHLPRGGVLLPLERVLHLEQSHKLASRGAELDIAVDDVSLDLEIMLLHKTGGGDHVLALKVEREGIPELIDRLKVGLKLSGWSASEEPGSLGLFAAAD